jgi:hypothetical protein
MDSDPLDPDYADRHAWHDSVTRVVRLGSWAMRLLVVFAISLLSATRATSSIV